MNEQKSEPVERRSSPWREIVEVVYAELAAEPRESTPATDRPAGPKKAR